MSAYALTLKFLISTHIIIAYIVCGQVTIAALIAWKWQYIPTPFTRDITISLLRPCLCSNLSSLSSSSSHRNQHCCRLPHNPPCCSYRPHPSTSRRLWGSNSRRSWSNGPPSTSRWLPALRSWRQHLAPPCLCLAPPLYHQALCCSGHMALCRTSHTTHINLYVHT